MSINKGMTAMTILRVATKRKGKFRRAAWVRDCKTLKGAPAIRKSTVMTVRAGIDYDKMQAVIDKRANGELPKENAGLPWGAWRKYPFLIEHKGMKYLRLYPEQDSVSKECMYFIAGQQFTFSQVEQYLTSDEKRPDPLCITVKLKDMVELY